MKYTRYDLKKKNNNRMFFTVLICGIVILAFACGTMISNLFIKDANKEKGKPVLNKNVNNIKQEDMSKYTPREIDYFAIVQCGVFSNDNNANILKNKLSTFGSPFIIKEDNKSKVILGIYSKKELENITSKLKENKIDFSKVDFNPDLTNECNLQIFKIIDAELQVISKFYDNKVKFVETKQLKQWCSKLNDMDKKEENYKLLCDLKLHIDKLPDKILRENLQEYNIFLYKTLKAFK